MLDCPVDQGCVEWVRKYLRDCVCNFRDKVSLTLGLVSVFSWGVAEVPQIITNFKEKSTEGISLAFLMTWVVGDVFNLLGCYLEPATLPTQFYMALLYTVTTLILVFQTIYYDYLWVYFHPELKQKHGEAEKLVTFDEETRRDPGVEGAGTSSPEVDGTVPSSTINVPHHRRASSRDLYYMSARSLASSYTPTVGSYFVGSRESAGQIQSFLRPPQGSVAAQEHPGHGSVSRADSVSSNSAGSFARTAAASISLVGTIGLSSNFLSGGLPRFAQAGLRLRHSGRSLLQTSGSKGYVITNYLKETQPDGPWGEVFGWCMAAIYMGGRLPQILLNIKRGTVEGLNPLMFVFALVGNATYVGSILVRNTEWAKIKPNLPWLVDAGVCVILDFFIICQFVYYASRAKREDPEQEEDKMGSYDLVR
ncbi:unnamed protein product [Calypogeia fissa]